MSATGKRDFTQGVGFAVSTGGRTLAVATISRERASLEAELAMERNCRVD